MPLSAYDSVIRLSIFDSDYLVTVTRFSENQSSNWDEDEKNAQSSAHQADGSRAVPFVLPPIHAPIDDSNHNASLFDGSRAVPFVLPPIHTPINDSNHNASLFESFDDGDERQYLQSEEPNIKDVLMERNSKLKPEVEWYRIKDIKCNLVDINCQRIFKVLTEGAVDMNLSLLVPLFCRNLMELPSEVFSTMKNSLLQFQSLLEDFMNATGTSMRRKTEVGNPVAMQNARSIEGNIKRHLRTIIKAVKTPDDEELQSFVEELHSHKPAAVQDFQREYDRFREAMHIRLGFDQRQLVLQADKVHQSVSRNSQQKEQISLLENKLSRHEQKTKVLCDELDKKIEKVASNASNVKKNSAAQVKIRNGLLNEVQAASATSAERQKKLEDQKKNAQATLNIILDEHVKEETKLREKKYKMETERDNWMQKYDKDMGTIQDQLNPLWVDYAAQRKVLEALEEKFSVLEITYNEIIATREAEAAERTRARRELLSMSSSAAIIQAWWRTRAVLKKLQGKGKKGKGKK